MTANVEGIGTAEGETEQVIIEIGITNVFEIMTVSWETEATDSMVWTFSDREFENGGVTAEAGETRSILATKGKLEALTTENGAQQKLRVAMLRTQVVTECQSTTRTSIAWYGIGWRKPTQVARSEGRDEDGRAVRDSEACRG